MKSLIRIKETLACGVRRYGRMLSLLVAFTALSSGAWGTTYYVYLSEGKDNPSYMTKVGSTTETSYTISRTFETGKNYYVMFLTTDQVPSTDTNVSNQHIKNKKGSYSSSNPFSWIGKQEYGLGSAAYAFLGFSFSSATGSVTVSISNLSGSSPTQADYTVSAGDTPTSCQYYLRHTWVGSTWSNVLMTAQSDGTYTLKKKLGDRSKSFDIATNSTGEGTNFSTSKITYVNNPQTNDDCLFIYQPKKDDCTIDVNNDKITVVKQTAATIWMGDYPEQEGTDIKGNIFLAQTGGAEITSIKVYYGKDAAPDLNSNNYVEIEKPVGGFVCGQLYEYALTDMCLIGSGNYQIQAVAENASGKANSDIVSYNNFVCCPGIISSFKIEPTAKYVMPGELVEFKTTIQGGGANPTYVWKEKVGSGEETALVSTASNLSYVVPQGLEGGTQVTVSVTVTGSNCPDDVRTEQAVLTVCNTPVISSLAVVETPAAWTATTITASVSNADKAEWTSMPNAELTGKSLSGATFRGGVTSTGDPYKVTIKAIENSCGNSVEQTIDVTINPDTEQCN